MYKLIVMVVFFLSYLNAESEYELGSGVQVGSLPLFVGGYLSLDYKMGEDSDTYRLNDIAFLAYGTNSKFSYLGEFEYKNFYTQTYAADKITTHQDRRLYAERLYLEYNHDENYKFKIGKYNSPVGFWNLLPINVLRQTTSNPITSDILFPTFTTGVGISRTSFREYELKVEFMLQNNEDLDDEYNSYEIDEHYGINILYEKDDFSLKLNGGYFHRIETASSDKSLYYFLLSMKYEKEKYQLMGEVGEQFSKERVTTPYAGYIQGLYRLSEEHIASLRVESYDDSVANIKESVGIVAYTYRPLYPIALKSEYQFHSIESKNQFIFSFSVLF